MELVIVETGVGGKPPHDPAGADPAGSAEAPVGPGPTGSTGTQREAIQPSTPLPPVGASPIFEAPEGLGLPKGGPVGQCAGTLGPRRGPPEDLGRPSIPLAASGSGASDKSGGAEHGASYWTPGVECPGPIFEAPTADEGVVIMPRRMAFSKTIPQMYARTKDVTRRRLNPGKGWDLLRPGDRITAIEKGMGLKKGERQTVIGEIEVVSVRREALCEVTHDDVAREGFPGQGADWFLRKFGGAREQLVLRIEFRHVEAS